MKSQYIKAYNEDLLTMRKQYFEKLKSFSNESLNTRSLEGKWSANEHLYHTVLIIRTFRRYFALAVPVLGLLSGKKTLSPDDLKLYNIYDKKDRKKVKAPAVVSPPSKIRNIDDIINEIDHEWELFLQILENISDEKAAAISIWIPMVGSRNLIQWIKGIHYHDEVHYQYALNTVSVLEKKGGV